jgi:hypothetical protein
MSLDLHILAPRLGEEPADAFDRVEAEDDLAPADPAAVARDERLAAHIRALAPGLEEHRSRYGLSLVGDLLAVAFSRQYATVTVDPDLAEDRAALAGQALAACRAIAAATGWSVVNAQRWRLVSPVADAQDLLRELEEDLAAEQARPAGLLARLFGRS